MKPTGPISLLLRISVMIIAAVSPLSKAYGQEDLLPATETVSDSVSIENHPDTTANMVPVKKSDSDMWWWTLAKQRKLNLADTAVVYPKFLGFCVDVYNWGDRFFNGTDRDYVVGTGKRWKARMLSDNWNDGYTMALPHGLKTQMLSDLYSNIGGYIQYMAVSMGYSYDFSNLLGTDASNHKKWEFGFNCQRFNVELYLQENTGGTYLRRFGEYRDGAFIKRYFPGVSLHTMGLNAIYFFNNKRYSHGAAYNFSKIQKKSQGSWIAGVSINNIKLSFDFSRLPPDMIPFLTIEPKSYMFHYNSYTLVGGYGYNWVIKPRLLFNVTVLPAVGISYCYEDSIEGEKWKPAFNVLGRTSLTYNYNNWFFSIIGKLNGSWYRSGTYSLFSSIQNFSANVGIRF